MQRSGGSHARAPSAPTVAEPASVTGSCQEYGTVTSDSDLVAEMLAMELACRGDMDPGEAFDEALTEVLPRLHGAFSLVLADHALRHRAQNEW